MIRSLDQLVSGLSVKRKISLLTFILVIPLFLIITIALSLLGARLHDSIRSNMADSRQSVINAFSFFRKQTTTYAGLIAAHYNVRRGVYFSNTGMILQYAAPVLKETQLDFIIVHDRNRVILCRAHAPDDFNIDDRNNRAVGLALEGKSSWAVEPHEKDIVLRTTVPVYHLTTRGFIVGAVTVGYKMNNSFAEELKKVGGVDVLFVEDEFIFASSFGNLLQLPESLAANSFVRKIAGVSFDISRIPVNSPVIENLKIVVAGDNSAITIAFTRILWGIGILFLLTAGASLLLSLKIGGNITASTGTILKSTEEISRRNYDIDIRLDTRDEFKTLADTYNVMATNIKGSFNTIREQTREIETLKNFLSNIIESMPSILIAIDEKGVINEWNRSAFQFTGIPAYDAVGRILWEIAPRFGKYASYCKGVMRSGEPVEFYRESLKAEEVTYHNVSLFPLDTEGAGGVAIRIDDITEMEKKEEQLRQSQKMEIVGTLAGGLAHDFNNVLGGITGALSIINNRMKKKPDMPIGQMSDFFQVIGESAERAVEMVQQVLSLSRKSNVAFAPMDLNKSLDRVIKICQNTFDKSIELKPRYADGKAVVNGNATQLDQVLLNLCVNASHAMTIMRPEGETPGGFLEIKIDKIAAGRHFVSTHPEASEIDYWHVAVEDSGVGMNGDTMAKIFDPFFTTKHGVSKGTGLGLAMVYNLVRQHLGFIDIYSEPGEGTVFNVYVPVYYSDVAAADKKDNDELIYGEGLILVVDDESVMLHMTREILTDCGYDVVTAVNGEDGVRIFRNLEKKIRGVILDVMMPRMSGKEAFVEMKKIDPDIKVLVISGYKHHERIEELYALGIKEFLQKPYTAHKLSDALWRILG